MIGTRSTRWVNEFPRRIARRRSVTDPQPTQRGAPPRAVELALTAAKITLSLMAPPQSSQGVSPQIQIVIDEAMPGVIELRATGIVSLPELRDAYRSLAQARSRRGDLRCMLLDAEAVTRFGRGAVVEAARWITRNAHYFDLAITVTRSPSLKSAALALSACAPTLRHVVVSDRAEAIAMLRGRSMAMAG